MYRILQGRQAAAIPRWRTSRPGGTRGAALAIVIAALALLLLKPFCDLAFAAAGRVLIAPAATTMAHGVAGHAVPGTTPSGACCTDVADSALLMPAVPIIPWLPDAPLGAALFILAGLPLFAGSRQSVRFCLAAPPERSFYARSARILR